MFYRCIVLLIMVVSISSGFVTIAGAQAFSEEGDIPPQKLEALMQASAELDAFFEAHHRRLERAQPHQIEQLQLELTTTPKAILDRYGLTSADLQAWRLKLESHGDLSTQAIEDPHFHNVVKRLLPRE